MIERRACKTIYVAETATIKAMTYSRYEHWPSVIFIVVVVVVNVDNNYANYGNVQQLNLFSC